MRVLACLVAFGTLGMSRANADDHADALHAAERLEAALEYERALVVADQAIAAGGHDRVELAALHFLAGRVAAGLDKPDIAERHFAIALALDPSAALPDGTSPKLTQPFDVARSKSVPLHVELRSTARAVTTTATDPLGLVTTVRVHVARGADLVHAIDRAADRTQSIELPAGAIATSADALDEHGNVLVHADLAPPMPIVTEPPIYARWSTWAIASGVALAGAGACAWRFGVAQDEWNRLSAGGHDYSELVAIEDRGRAWAIAADIGFGVTAASAIVAAVLYASHRDAGPVQLTVAPMTIGLAARF